MAENADQNEKLVQLAAQGDERALEALFAQHRDRLRCMVALRMNSQLQRRVDASDVIQEAYVEAAGRLKQYLNDPQAPFFLWIRSIVCQKLIDVHRRHLHAQKRDARQEISLHRQKSPEASSASLAAQLLGSLSTPSQAARKAEMQLRVQEALGEMDPIDRGRKKGQGKRRDKPVWSSE